MFDAADVVVVVFSACVPAHFVGEEVSLPDSNPCQRANSRRRWFVLSHMSPSLEDAAVRVFQGPYQPMVIRAPSAPGSSYPCPFLPY